MPMLTARLGWIIAGVAARTEHRGPEPRPAYESVDMIADPGLSLTVYVAEPASPTAHALDLLASWAGTTAEADSPVAR